jgi:hypothetical protein
MSSLTLLGDTSGSVVLDAPAISGSTVLTLPTTTSTLAINGPAFSAYTTTTQAITGAATTKVNFAGELFDTNNCFASSRFTPTVAGYYQLTTSFSYNASTFSDVYIYKNGAVYQTIFGNYDKSTFYASGTGLVYLNGTTDYAEIYLYSSGSVNINSSQANCWFSGAMVRGA